MARNPEIVTVDPDLGSRAETKRAAQIAHFTVIGEAGYGVEAVTVAREGAPDIFLVSMEEMRSVLGETGFTAELLEDTSDAHLNQAAGSSAPSPLTLGVYVDNLAQKAGNARRSLEEGQIRLVRAVFRAQ